MVGLGPALFHLAIMLPNRTPYRGICRFPFRDVALQAPHMSCGSLALPPAPVMPFRRQTLPPLRGRSRPRHDCRATRVYFLRDVPG